MGHKILLIESDETTADHLIKGLKDEDFTVDRACNGCDGRIYANDGSYEAIIIDHILPVIDGMAMLKTLRTAKIKTPVILISALGMTDDRLMGPLAGSTDYLSTPFAFAELLARVQSHVRGKETCSADETNLVCGDLELNLLTREAKRGATTLTLQPREIRLLEYLMRRSDLVVTRMMLLEGVWDIHFDPGTKVIDAHVRRLRSKIDDGHLTPLVHTVRGAGYRLGPAA